MRPKTRTLTPGFPSSRQREQGQSTCPWRFREKGWGRGDSGSAPDVPEEPGPDVPSTRGGGEWGLNWAMITATEVGERIAQVVRSIVTQLFEIATPILTAIGIAEILIGLLMAAGFRQEFIGYRLIIAGVITLVFTYVVVPFLLSFL